jgi:hypothetical protein
MNPRGLTILMAAWVLMAAGACGKSKRANSGGSAGSTGSGSESSSSSPAGGSSGAGGSIITHIDAGVPISDAAPASDGRTSGDSASAGGSTSSTSSTSTGFGGRGGGGGSRPPGTGGSTGKTDAGTSGPCRVEITAATESSLLNLAPGDNRTLAIKGKIVWGSTTPLTPTWEWSVKSPDQTLLPTTEVPTSESNSDSIQFPLLSPGTYDISVSVTDKCSGHATATAAKERSQSFFVRVLPPPSGGPNAGQSCGSINRWCPSEDAVPYEDKDQILEAGLPKELGISLLKGHAVSIDPMQLAQPDPTAFPPIAIPSTIKVTPHNSTWTIDGASTNDKAFVAMMHPMLKYDVLVVPSASVGTDAARFVPPPFRIGNRSPQEFSPDDFSVAQGVTVKGTIRVAGAPLMGARVLLRAEASDPVIVPLPSTWGSSDVLGAYLVRAQGEGLFSVIVIPPAGTTLPQVTIPGCMDLRNASNGSTIGNVDFDWNTMALTMLSITVMMPDGQSPAPSVKIRLQSKDDKDETTPQPAMPEVGKLTISGEEADAPKGSLRLEATTDKSGMVTFGGIPKAHYRVVLLPPDNLSDAAMTTVDLDLRGTSDDEHRVFPLPHRVKLTGRILPPTSSSGGHVVAIDTGDDILGNSISSNIESDGSYTLMADPGRTYRFSVEPAPGKNLPARIPLYGVTTPSQNARLADRSLPAGLKVTGTVKFSNRGVPGAIVQAYCQQSGMSGCVDPDNPSPTLPPPLVEIATQADGSFSFYLLDPG